MNEDLENLLRNYVEDQRRQNIAGTVQKIFDKFVEHEAKDDARHEEMRGEIRGLSLRVGDLEKDHGKAGKLSLRVGAIEKQEVEKLRDTATWWKRTIVGSVLAVATGGVGWLLGLLLGGKR
jgi:hypothetical protein